MPGFAPASMISFELYHNATKQVLFHPYFTEEGTEAQKKPSHWPRMTQLLIGRAKRECSSLTPEPVFFSTMPHPLLSYQRDRYNYICATCVKGWSEHNKMK